MSLQKNAQTMLDNLEFIKAAAAGKTVEIKVGNTWMVWSKYDFTAPLGSYRIKREPITKYVIMKGDLQVRLCDNHTDAVKWVGPFKEYRIVELREVVKE